MKYISIILSLLINISFCIGLKALVIPNNATMIAISGSGVSDYIDIKPDHNGGLNLLPILRLISWIQLEYSDKLFTIIF